MAIIKTQTFKYIKYLKCNVRGILRSTSSVFKLLKMHGIDVAFLTEHKLVPQSKSIMHSVHKNDVCYTECDDSVKF